MCFYHHQSWTCGRWQWGALAKRCHQGAVDPSACGLKLIYYGLEKKHSCPNCKQHRKADHERRMAAVSISALNPQRDQARIYSLEADVRRLDAEMEMLTKEHQSSELIPKEPINMWNVD
ncbi:hypothetical protein N3K66_000852 [Trichothecium roseum]|uniref:Uncharacterized protein n=1 Tax=Trichothecium roseum TaxID=47278 RepID=A0ACC0VEY2_9HYPO|nr:hypothetical protein N3K66_000852 [Trichothecium roseum]